MKRKSTMQHKNNKRLCTDRQTTPMVDRDISTPVSIDFRSLISATGLRNYLLGDPILDWFKVTGAEKSDDPLTNLLFSKGKAFEIGIIDKIRERYPITDLSRAYGDFDIQPTIEALRRQDPILFQATVADPIIGVFGCPDLLLRRDIFNELFPDQSLPEEHGPYVVVEIKMGTLILLKDGYCLNNEPLSRAYKGQVFVYNRGLSYALSLIDSSTPPITTGFILGRKWNHGDTRGSSFERLAKIENSDIEDDVMKALSWLTKVKLFGKTWKLGELPELYPNMANNYDFPYGEAKKAAAQELGEITSLWQCGLKHRQRALEAGVTRWDDERCTGKLLGFGKDRAKIINKILTVNRNKAGVLAPKIKLPSRKNEYYLDFETINEIFSGVPISGTFVYWIGVGYIKDGVWHYQELVAKELSEAEERRIFSELLQLIPSRSLVFHWSQLESRMLSDLIAKYDLEVPNWLLYDLLETFRSAPIVVEGAFDFGMKSIAKALFQLGKIDTIWENSFCKNGSDSIVLAKAYYDGNQEVYEEMKAYNQMDCKVMKSIVEFARRELSK